MFTHLNEQYLPELDKMLREIVAQYPDPNADFTMMLQYPMGWVDENGTPYTGTTGKRLRPILLLLVADTMSEAWRNALPAAAAVELLHNFSLIHDDIQDQSDIRHNRPTVWKIWGIPNAINAGDAMFTLAYVALENLSQHAIPHDTLLEIWQIFNKTNLELTRGQHLDMLFEKRPLISEENYMSMIAGKTGALIAACAQIGALIATRDKNIAKNLSNFALNLGIAFQMRDDILGIWGEAETIGKSTVSDIVSRKKSLPVVYGLQHSSKLRELYSLKTFQDAHVADILSILDSVEAKQYTQMVEMQHFDLAMNTLEKAIPDHDRANPLRQFATTLMERSY